MDDLTTLLREAVADVDPSPRTAELRAGLAAAGRRRRRMRVAGGLLAAAAVTIVGVGLATDQPSVLGTETATSPSAPATERTATYAVYYAGQTPHGPRLYREFRAGSTGTPDPAGALALMQAPPADPDYRTLWPAGTFSGARVVDEQVEVEVARPDLVTERTAGMSPDEAELALQQVVYTVTASVGEVLPVRFTHEGALVDRLLGISTQAPLSRAPQLDVLALVSISNPTEGRVADGYFSADGVASSFEGTVIWQLVDTGGGVVRSGAAQASGWLDRLYPWATGRIDVSDLPPGEYTFEVRTDDPSGGEGGGPTVDTRTIIVG